MKSIFVSHVHEDNYYLEKMKHWESLSNNGYTITYETEDLRYLGGNAIKKHLRNKVRGAAIVLFLIGNDTHNRDWIIYEVELANSYHKQICCVRIPGTTGRTPTILNKYKTLTFDPNSILKALR